MFMLCRVVSLWVGAINYASSLYDYPLFSVDEDAKQLYYYYFSQTRWD